MGRRDLQEQSLMLITVAIVLVAIAGIVWFVAGRTNATARLRRQLEHRILGDQVSTAQRLIDGERRRRPEASEKELIEAALRRLEQDNR
jgi:nitrogen fixation-related uncharacterized protein